jgi:hypothetical protein
LAEGPKFIDFSAGMPAVIHGGPPPRRAAWPAAGRRDGTGPVLPFDAAFDKLGAPFDPFGVLTRRPRR